MKKTILEVLLLSIILFFNACEEEEIEVIKLNYLAPEKTVYWENEKLNLNGLKLLLEMEDGSMEIIEFSDFESNNIITEPKNGTILTSDVDEVIITHNSSGKSVSCEITVRKILLTLKSTEKIADTPFENPVATVIYNDLLYVLAEEGLFSFDFVSNNWNTISMDHLKGSSRSSYIDGDVWRILYYNDTWMIASYDFNTQVLTNKHIVNGYYYDVGSLYENDTLYIFGFNEYSDNSQKLLMYDFENDMLKTLSDNSGFKKYNYPGFHRNVVNIDNINYFIVYYVNNIDLYSFDSENKYFNLKEFYHSYYNSHSGGPNGVFFNYKDILVFGLGGSEGTYPKTLLCYDPKIDEFSAVVNEMSESIINTLPIEYNGDIYLIGGSSADDISSAFTKRKKIEKLIFE